MNGQEVKNGNPEAEVNQEITADLEQEAQRNDALVQTATESLKLKISALEHELTVKDQELEGAKAAYAFAVVDFKKACLEINPLVTDDMLTGNTVEELKTSFYRSNVLINQLRDGIRKDIETDQGNSRIPAGSPTRKEPDLSTMTTAEKINYGLEKSKKK